MIFINARTLPLIYLYTVPYGLSYGATVVSFPAILGAYYGRKNYSAIIGLGTGITNLVAAVSPTFAGFVFDATGSYLIPLTTAAALLATGAVCALLARSPKAPQP